MFIFFFQCIEHTVAYTYTCRKMSSFNQVFIRFAIQLQLCQKYEKQSMHNKYSFAVFYRSCFTIIVGDEFDGWRLVCFKQCKENHLQKWKEAESRTIKLNYEVIIEPETTMQIKTVEKVIILFFSLI